jgi:hypothetical protein
MAAFFACLFLICVGICGYSPSHSGNEFGGTPGFFSFIGMAVAAISLIAICIAALIELVANRNS